MLPPLQMNVFVIVTSFFVYNGSEVAIELWLACQLMARDDIISLAASYIMHVQSGCMHGLYYPGDHSCMSALLYNYPT